MGDKKVVVMGGGIAGVTAARELASLGVPSVVVEKSDFVGGHAASYACKAAPECQKCNACEVDKALKELAALAGVEVLRASTVVGVSKKQGAFEVTVARAPVYVDPAKCTDCGLCLDACPAAGAVKVAPSAHVHPRYAIDPSACVRLNGADPKCEACVAACPFGAIDLAARATTTKQAAGGIVVATGFAPYDPAKKPALGHGTHPDVITAVELEALLRKGTRLARPSNGEPAARVAFVQCVGSRDKDNPYCSRVCCGYALRMAEAILKRNEGADVQVFYIDFQPVGKDNERYLAKYRQDLGLVRTLVGDVYPLPSGKLRVTYQHQTERTLTDEEFDLVVLAVAIAPGEDNARIAELLGVGVDGCGFLAGTGAGETNLTKSPAVVLAGTATGPMDVASAMAHAKRAAWQVAKAIGE